MDSPSIMEQAERPYISTGHLSEPGEVRELVPEAQRRFTSNAGGRNYEVYPALATLPSDPFGIRMVGASGRVYATGDTDVEFSIMSASKPFVFALICGIIGPEEAREPRPDDRWHWLIEGANHDGDCS